jgi:hypothetical protein
MRPEATMSTKLTIAITMATLAFAGCKKEGESAGGASAKTSEGAQPEAFAAWVPKEAPALWQGAWQGRISLQGTKKKTTTLAGDKVAIEIKNDTAMVSDGETDFQMKFELHAPCIANFIQGNMKDGRYTYGMMFVVEGGVLKVSSGAAGYRKGKTALVCSEGMEGGVTLVDDKGCATWKVDFMDKTWVSKPTTCAWSQQDGKDMLTIGTGDWATKVIAEGDVLKSEQFARNEKLHSKATDFATAKTAVSAEAKKDDPIEQAKLAGGVAGKTDTIASLHVSLGADESLKGKQVEVTGVLKQLGTMKANGEESQQFVLKDVDSKDDKIDMFCSGKTPPYEGAKAGDKVIAKGTVDKSFGKAELEDCSITLAK